MPSPGGAAPRHGLPAGLSPARLAAYMPHAAHRGLYPIMGYAPSSAYSDTGASSMERSGVHGPSRPGSDVSSEWSHGTASPMQVGDRGISLGIRGRVFSDDVLVARYGRADGLQRGMGMGMSMGMSMGMGMSLDPFSPNRDSDAVTPAVWPRVATRVLCARRGRRPPAISPPEQEALDWWGEGGFSASASAAATTTTAHQVDRVDRRRTRGTCEAR
ncbi:hypothetical protein CXG81DRAFT_16771 [Caulochytrium protostelioides]|uniref:Uncharacterized protein n=1 Tax=Caulochytrium protostelioides TaxID=1555241 RepID=A0A4P9XET3_9FUNG|nr:hypothetical protein CXG81DRAFT_16771 [Caulochytrium protostelioides]|eukprot:RKP03671.1 hypothetical protein CXG81DRAFT_16771 [Caulochytrium protostelioides]